MFGVISTCKYILTLVCHDNGCPCILAPRQLALGRDNRISKHHPGNKTVIVCSLGIFEYCSQHFKMCSPEKEVHINEGLACQKLQCFRINTENFPAAAFRNAYIVTCQMSVLSLIPTMLKGLFIDKIGHDILFKVDLISNVGIRQQAIGSRQ